MRAAGPIDDAHEVYVLVVHSAPTPFPFPPVGEQMEDGTEAAEMLKEEFELVHISLFFIMIIYIVQVRDHASVLVSGSYSAPHPVQDHLLRIDECARVCSPTIRHPYRLSIQRGACNAA